MLRHVINHERYDTPEIDIIRSKKQEQVNFIFTEW